MATNLFISLLLLHVIILLFLNVCDVHSSPARYDQSQFGDYNVQIHLKNIELYAILDEGMLNSEYDYDYSDLTEKPSTTSSQQQEHQSFNATTARPISNITSGHSSNYSSSNNSFSSINSSAIMITNQLLATPERINATFDHDESKIKQQRPCNPGYYRDHFGRCRKQRRPQIAYQQTVHTPGVIKSFQPNIEKNAAVTNN